MEQIYWVKNGELNEVNRWLQKGGRVKSIHVVPENFATYGFAGGESSWHDKGKVEGDIYAYIVIEFD